MREKSKLPVQETLATVRAAIDRLAEQMADTNGIMADVLYVLMQNASPDTRVRIAQRQADRYG